jgi:hypothetical protein
MKPLFLASLAALAASASLSAAASAAPNRLDLNGDARVDGRDADQLATMLAPAGVNGRVPAISGTPFDINNDGMLSRADWQAYIASLTSSGATEALFDVIASPGAPTMVGSPDRMALAQAVSQGTSNYRMRYDLNGDGSLDLRDWATFLSYYRFARPELLIDFNGNGTVSGVDLDLIARVIDARSFDQAMDLNADGKVTKADYQAAVAIVSSYSPKSLFDVDGRSTFGQPILSPSDGIQIGTAIEGLNVGFPVSIRYDFDGDGLVTPADWATFVRYAVQVYKKPDVVYDVTGDDVVDISDVLAVASAADTHPVRYQLDVNADGVVDVADVMAIKRRISKGALQLLPGDVNRDGCVTAADLQLVQASMGLTTSYYTFEPDLDVNESGAIDAQDLQQVSANLGRCIY